MDSGYGVHAYWPLIIALSAADGKALADKFKVVCNANQLRADPTVTADIARILRIPGTHNYKDPENPKLVKIKGPLQKYDTVTIIASIEACYKKSGTEPMALNVEPLFSHAQSKIPAYIQSTATLDQTKSLIGNIPKSFAIILKRNEAGNGCAQLKNIFDNQASIDEPHWRAGLSIARFCEDGASAIHDISNKHPKYTAEATEAKATTIKGPYTCDTFKSNWPDECKGCQFYGKITSPIQLGSNNGVTSNPIAAPLTWAPAEPLPDYLLPVAAFDMNLLPVVLQPWAKDIVDRMQCPTDFVGATIMSALGTVIGRRVGIRPKMHDDWTEYCNLWTCIVGRPGVMKSPAMDAALAPLKALGAKASHHYDIERTSFDDAAQLRSIRIDAQKRNLVKTLAKDPKAAVDTDLLPEPEAPILKRYIVNDATVEALLDICIENPQGVCAYRDELVALLKSLEREGQESARGFYLTGWNGNSGYTADRIGRGRNMHAEAVCLSVLGSTQPGRIADYLRTATVGGTADDGLIQR
ncbi:MAG: DUF3987 domain-containing protein, partial [Herbaspirillum sp.]